MDIKTTICNIVEDKLGYEATPESNIVQDLGGDSLDLVEICMEVEREFDIHVPDDDFVKWQTVQDIIEYVEKAKC